MFSHRVLKNTDAEEIVKFPVSADELFFLFPKADYPLKSEALLNRKCSGEPENTKARPCIIFS